MVFAGVLVLMGLAARLSPLLDIEGHLFWQYMTEDGYLMQTVARNMAIGLGMSTAEGTIATNGVQPLATYLFAGLHALAQGDKMQAIVLVTLFSTLIAAISAGLLACVGTKVFSHLPHGRNLALVAAALWFTAPLITRHSMNGLETGLYQATLMLVTLFFLQRFCTPGTANWRSRLLLGFLLGLSFLARNDAVFFIAALLMTQLLIPVPGRSDSLSSRFITALVAGSVSIVVASPWLINNYLGFGSIVPISGTAQSHAADLGRNLPWVAAHLFENAWLWLPVPGKLETLLPVQLVTFTGTAAALVAYWFLVGRQAAAARIHFVAGMLFTAGLVTYYGLFFGASWFLPRYFSAASPFLWLFIVGAVYMGARTILVPGRLRLAVACAGMACLTAMAALFAANDYRKGSTHMHKQVVDWTQANLKAEDWAGAPQTGTLGYFHDRTINLDGKVNPEALRSLLDDGHILDYVLASPVQYIVDWVGMAQWVNLDHFSTRFGQEFEVVV
ncbi:MAG TPA: hypothetical protein VFY22_00810, partial [Hydrogenophaga sp.]|nr:hypothetical protein [Hydrogenophaga sp.]